jgi:hypothetical protein
MQWVKLEAAQAQWVTSRPKHMAGRPSIESVDGMTRRVDCFGQK